MCAADGRGEGEVRGEEEGMRKRAAEGAADTASFLRHDPSKPRRTAKRPDGEPMSSAASNP